VFGPKYGALAETFQGGAVHQLWLRETIIFMLFILRLDRHVTLLATPATLR